MLIFQVVTVMSNHKSHEPLAKAKRFNHETKKFIWLPQPQVVFKYNQTMGGVDLFDNAMNNYRISMRGKKWYWPLFTNALDAAMVNSWKLHCLCAKYERKIPMSQYEFRLAVVEDIIVPMAKTRYSHGKAVSTGSELSVRMDRVDHFTAKLDKRSRCFQCGGKTMYGCQKCNTNLHTKCFVDYHNNKPRDQAKIFKSQ